MSLSTENKIDFIFEYMLYYFHIKKCCDNFYKNIIKMECKSCNMKICENCIKYCWVCSSYNCDDCINQKCDQYGNNICLKCQNK